MDKLKQDELQKEFEEIIGYKTGAILSLFEYNKNVMYINEKATPDLDTAKLWQWFEEKLKAERKQAFDDAIGICETFLECVEVIAIKQMLIEERDKP